MKKEPIRKWEGMPSSTNPAKKYTVCMYVDGTFSCNCPRWSNALSCGTCGGSGTRLQTACIECNGTGRRARNCTHIIVIQTVYRLREVDMQIDAARNMPIVKRKITRAED